jgi:methylmalonyl-CoA mutase cobalamin-binding domain/chain
MKTLSGRVKSLKLRPRREREIVRVLTAVPICDGHDSPIITINIELARHGVEVIYFGYHRAVRDIVRAAIQEDVHAVGISSYNGGHVEFFTETVRLLRKKRAGHIRVFGGGGGTITPEDARLLKRRGVDQIFFAGTPMETIIDFVLRRYGSSRHRSFHKLPRNSNDLEISQMLTAAEAGSLSVPASPGQSTRVIGIAGAGGAGKSTLIDELTLRFLRSRPRGRLAILSHDPSMTGRGAVLGDRATMVYAQSDRVFMRSLGTRGQSGGLARGTKHCVAVLRRAGFDIVIVESAGIGQEDLPFARGLVDRQVLVMSPEYGSRLQLQKIIMLETADVVVLNKKDLPGARTALAEIQQRLDFNDKTQKLVATTAKVHLDPGVDQLFQLLSSE